MGCTRAKPCLSLFVVIAFWYKPDATHQHLYPSLKDAAGNPIKVTSDGDVQYAVDPAGIEVFRTKDGPQGLPTPAAFATAVNNESQVVCCLPPPLKSSAFCSSAGLCPPPPQ